MSTNGSFTPPGTPPCDDTIHTPAALRALRDAGALRVECHYRVAANPIGTTGNTSPTVVELHATDVDHLSMEGKLQTTFYTDAWHCIYDLDLGPNGSFQEVTDNWNNTVLDPDPDGAGHTIVDQFPWHLGSDLLRDNTLDDVTLPGLAAYVAAGGEFRDNELRETTVDLTGVTSPGPAPASFFRRNVINSGTVALHVPTVYVNNNSLNNAFVTHDGTGAGSFSFQLNTVLGGELTVDAATTAQVTFNSNIIGGGNGGYRTRIVGKTVAPLIVVGNRMYNQSVLSYDMQISGDQDVSVTSNEITAGTITLSGLGDVLITGNTLSSTSLNQTGSGVFNVNTSTIGGSVVTLAASATRGLTMSGALVNGSSITQNGTGSTNTDTFFASSGTTLQDATVNLNATSAATPNTSLLGLVAIGASTVTVGDTVNTQPVRHSRVEGASTLTIGGGGSAVFNRSQLRAGASLVCNHDIQFAVIEGQFTKTSTGNATNVMCNALGDTWPF